ncbi:MAG: hypothetical protein COT67_01035 [Candidatus Tagabacteria bacterium CG09_land_8_20_14_0_10_41_14]|uniref:DUF4367 domain-containing protein n=2 Tax=Candidatus Tagaibacteriota TaxID=1817918 RepID=A0A2H0WLP6_9BACT|nr:MAG: hypothetical protein COT67_01035 [Candidatus Tagabacteria bacterium CG09_land_8_20_14_0_10_41_14]PJE72856.1 MAG: hypothetical protein COV00_03015 [Candidatus Tagabacteria bacterium CG10_big_fil_rev_8_21_14_0_10_40_13]
MANQNTNQPEEQQKKTEEKTDLHALRTFKSDLSETLKEGKMSIADIYLKQKEIPQNGRKTESQYLKRAALFSFIALAMTAAGVFIFFLIAGNNGEEPQNVQEAPPAILINEQEIILEVSDKTDFGNKFSLLFEKSYNAGNLIYLPVKTTGGIYLTSKDFLNLLESNAPGLTTSFITEKIQLSLLNLQRLHPILILEIQKGQYDSAFAGLLRWEKQLPQDLNFILSKGETPPRAVFFEDKLIKNQSVRALKKEGETIMLYSVFNKKYIIITDDEIAFEEIIKRIQYYL